MEMTAALLRQLRPEIEAALADLGEKYGIGFEVGDANNWDRDEDWGGGL